MGKALSLARVFDRVGYDPHSGQRLIHEAKLLHRFRIVCAGRRTGKSTAGGHELLPHAYEAYFRKDTLDPYTNRMEYWIVGPEYSDAEKEFRVLYSDLERLEFQFDHPGTYYDSIGGNMHISLFGGRFQVHAKSAKYPGTLVGEGLNGVILAEAAKLKPAVWPKYIRPMLVDTRGWSLMTSTPEGKNWFYDEYVRAKTSPDYWSIRMPSWVNDKLFPLGAEDPEVASLGEGLTNEAFRQEIGAEFADFVGKVFKDYDEDVHLRRIDYDPSLPVYAAVDYGFTNPFVWLLVQVDVWDNVYIVGEYYERRKRVEEACDELIERGLVPSGLRMFYPDPASPGDSRTIEERLRLKAMGGTGGEVKDRVNLIRKWLEIPKDLKHLPYEHPDRKPKLFIDPIKCPKTAFEFGEYRYPENKSEQDKNDSENPLKVDDHTPEALGRFFAGHFGKKQDSSVTHVRRASMSGARR
jgi:hypothetical protein